MMQFAPAWLVKRLPVRMSRPMVQRVAQPAHSLPDESTRQLLVDVSVIYQSDARTGIQRVVRSLLLQLLAAPPAGYQVCPVFATRRQPYSHASPGFIANVAPSQPQTIKPIVVKAGDLFLGLDLAAHLLPRHQSQLLKWKRRGVALHVMVYDLLPLQNPEWFNAKTTRNFSRWIKWVAVYADSAICISAFVKIQLAAWLGARFGLPAGALPTSTIVLGADIEASAPSDGLPPDADFLLARLRTTPAVLMVGTIEPRKGYDQALAAFEHLWQQPGKAPLLVIAGRPGWKTEALQKTLRAHPQAGKRLIWLDDASDEFLSLLYGACKGVLVASRAEGFGLPLVEATLYRRPVLARDLPVFRELALPGVTFFGGESAGSLATAISAWLQSTQHEDAECKSARYSYTAPTWQTAARQLPGFLGLSIQPPKQAGAGSASNSLAQESAA